MCGASSKGLMVLILVFERSKETKCLKIGWDKVSKTLGDFVPMGVWERSKWMRAEEKGRWTKLENVFSLMDK